MTADSTIWRLLIDSDLPGAHNMARDVAILETVSEGESLPTLRLYGWSPPCLTLGRHQDTDAADLEFCRAEGIDVVQRPTGGRALLHHLELTYAVIAPLGLGPLPRALQKAYSRICGALVRAMQCLGVEAVLTGGDVNLKLPGPRSTIPCFEAPAGGEVVVAGRKLIGSAMRAHNGVILQHGAILLGWDGRLQAGSMGLADDSSLRPHITSLGHELDQPPNRRGLERAIAQAFADEFEITFEKGDLTAAETARETALAASFAIED
jgi:lipoate-protein ligase A